MTITRITTSKHPDIVRRKVLLDTDRLKRRPKMGKESMKYCYEVLGLSKSKKNVLNAVIYGIQVIFQGEEPDFKIVTPSDPQEPT
jgi:hypothetical protein